MSENLENKKQLVSDLTDSLKGTGEKDETASTIIFNYSQLSASDMDSLRAKLREVNSYLKVVKNTLIKRTLNNLNVNLNEELTGQNAILVPDKSDTDFIGSLKKLVEFIKSNEKGAITLGVFNSSQLTQAQVKELAELPGREQLIARVVGGFASPIRNFMYVTNGVQSQFVRVISAIRDKKG